MSISKPYIRTSRQLIDGSYANSGNGHYVVHPKFAKDPEHYVRAYLLLQKDLEQLFDYVEPSDQNLACYSYRIHELLLRACVEVEANCKAILIENGYARKSKDLDMDDYRKLETSHRLSEFKVRFPAWSGLAGARTPFSAWAAGGSLRWYQAYNATKHDRHTAFRSATFEHMIDAVCACAAILAAQFRDVDFSSPASYLVTDAADGSEGSIGEYFRIPDLRILDPKNRVLIVSQTRGLEGSIRGIKGLKSLF